MSEANSDFQPNDYQSIDNENFFQRIWEETKRFFVAVGNFFSKNRYKFGLFLGALVIACAITASVFFGPALYTAITGLSAAVIPGLAAITAGLATTFPFAALAIIAATIVAAFVLGLFIAIESARSLKPQIKLSEVKSEERSLIPNQQSLDPNQQSLDPNQQSLDPNQQSPLAINSDEKENSD